MLNCLARWLVTFITLSFLLTWCFLNRGQIAFDFSPMHDPVSIPLFAIVLGASVMGFLWGAAMTWLGSAPLRAERRALKKERQTLLAQAQSQERALLSTHSDRVIEGLLPPLHKKRWL